MFLLVEIMSLPPVIDLGENAPIVIDNGSGWMKSGYSCDDKPRSIIPTMIGRPSNRVALEEESKSKKKGEKAEKECYIGAEAQIKKGNLVIKFSYFFILLCFFNCFVFFHLFNYYTKIIILKIQ